MVSGGSFGFAPIENIRSKMTVTKLYLNLFVMFLVFMLGTNYGFMLVDDEMFELRLCGYLMLVSVPLILITLGRNVLKGLK